MIKIFFDASVIFSAIYSNKGASFKLASLVKSGHILGITTQTVIEEVETNIFKFKGQNVKKIRQFIAEHNFIVRREISLSEIKPYTEVVETEDAHVIAGAILTSCNFLVTLDKKHLDNKIIRSKITQIKIISPRGLLKLL